MLNFWLMIVSCFGVAVFAFSGAMAAAERKLDILGFILFAIITGTGGGTLRDVLLGMPVFWVSEPSNLYICLVSALIAFMVQGSVHRIRRIVLWADALGISLFAVLGAAKAVSLGADSLVSTIMGVISATIGSLIRDVILNQEPLLLGPEIYVTATVLGSGLYVLLEDQGLPFGVSILLGIFSAFLLRSGAIIFGWSLPKS